MMNAIPSDRNHDELVFQRRPGIRAEKRPGDYRQGVEEPEAEDRLDGERPIAEPRSHRRWWSHEHCHRHVLKRPSRKPPSAHWQKLRRSPSKRGRKSPRNARALPSFQSCNVRPWRSSCE